MALLMRTIPEDDVAARCSKPAGQAQVIRLRSEDEMLVLITAAMIILQTGTTLRYVLVTLACPLFRDNQAAVV